MSAQCAAAVKRQKKNVRNNKQRNRTKHHYYTVLIRIAPANSACSLFPLFQEDYSRTGK